VCHRYRRLRVWDIALQPRPGINSNVAQRTYRTFAMRLRVYPRVLNHPLIYFVSLAPVAGADQPGSLVVGPSPPYLMLRCSIAARRSTPVSYRGRARLFREDAALPALKG
jgi:hypothetical protein